jgi:pilus assembly protein CpaB
MNRRRLLFIGFAALLIGTFSSSAVYRSMQKRMERPSPGTPVVVAARDLVPGEPLEERDLKVLAYPGGFLPDGVLHSAESVLKRSVLLPVGKGQFVTSSNVGIDGDKHTLERLIPAGMRAAAVSVDEVTSVAGFARPGSLVDVLVTGHAGTARLQSMTVLQRVRVLATGSQTDTSSQTAGSSARVVTLLVTPDDAEKLAFATQEGRIQLLIRNPIDSSQENRTPVSTLGDLPVARKIRIKYVPAPAHPDHEIELRNGDHIERIKVKD